MKQTNRYMKLFGWLTAATMLLTTSCKDDLFEGSNKLSENVTVTFTLTPEAASTIAMRSAIGNHVDYNQLHISDGSKADILIYAVYDGDTDELLYGYSKGATEAAKELGFDHGEGQTVKVINHFPDTINLALKRGAHYKIAFWAQSSKTKAYDTKDLKKVEVKYSELDNSQVTAGGQEGTVTVQTTTPNNDEYRDAFCRSIDITISNSAGAGLNQNVYLYRPLAQINVGTSGYDFESITRNSEKKYLYSKIRLNRVARYLDVVEDSVYSTTTSDESDKTYSQDDDNKTAESFAVVDFGYAPIPAYVNYQVEKKVGTYKLPEFPSYTIWDWTYGGDSYTHPHDMSKSEYEKEEFLKVNLYTDMRGTDGKLIVGKKGYTQDLDGDNYLDYANYTDCDGLNSETFKYLSMCYVLTSSTKTEKILINNVKMWMATDIEGGDSIEVVNLNHVPAQRNWRTNIVGNLLAENAEFKVILDKDFAGEYNGWADADNEWEHLTGQIADGVYYDAKADEIQISNANGLLWFQRMVNGDLKIRVASQENGTSRNVGEWYKYYKENSGGIDSVYLKYEGYTEQSYNHDDTMIERILRATHQDQRVEDQKSWPKNNNFHFAGATVKLMADIDLSNIDWIPIGFDYKVAEFNNPSNSYSDAFADNTAENRGFYGTFDGNGHTISNLTTKRFSAQVDAEYREQGLNPKNFDALPWFGRGLFGSIGGNAVIKNVRLQNIDILGCNGVGGIVGIAYGEKIKIDSCIVDGGKLTATPMYRNDTDNSRTFARGTYLGGIVGYFNTRKGVLTHCSVRNLTIKGYRQIGGLIGTIDKKYTNKHGEEDSQGKDTNSAPDTIAFNNVSNTTIIASQLHFPFGIAPHGAAKQHADQLGYGWGTNAEYDLYSGELLGGDYEYFLSSTLNKEANKGNISSGVTFSGMTNYHNVFNYKGQENFSMRISDIRAVPLEQMPPLSSWITDSIVLHSNYYGKPSAHKVYNVTEFKPKSTLDIKGPGKKEKGFYYPMKLPLEVEFDWDGADDKKNVGVYVETVKLDGKGGIGDRSVITPTNVDKEGGCCMYVTARDRSAESAGDIYTSKKHKYKKKVTGEQADSVALPTEIRNIVLRGEPYAYTGLLMAPNSNMDTLSLTNVAIYDVYQTIALDKTTEVSGNKWPLSDSIKAVNTDLILTDCNLRGYTVPGSGWKSITFNHTTFEEGAYIKDVYGNTGKREQAYTYDAEADVTFNHCYFKAPYIIKMNGNMLSFNSLNGKPCYATATSTENVELSDKVLKRDGKTATWIRIISDINGDPIVICYYEGESVGYGYKKNGPNGKTYDEDGVESTNP